MLRLGQGATRHPAWGAVEALVALAVATPLIALVEHALDIENASSVFLLAVAAVAIRRGTLVAVGTAVGAFLVYNFLFIDPRITLTVARPEEWVTLFLLLFLGVVIGRLAGRQHDREREALRREREARALFAITRELATVHRLDDAMRAVVERLAAETRMTRAWIGLGRTVSQERITADTDPSAGPTSLGTHSVLRRDRDERAATWTRIHAPDSGSHAGLRATGRAAYRVELRVGAEVIGSLWAERNADQREPYAEETRLLAAAADQVAQAVERDRLARSAAELEITRRTDEVRSALLDSVSHDLRTPLASIRAAAGSIADASIDLDDDERRATARSIDAEAARLNELVSALLDMSRIQAGALVADLEVIPLAELVTPVLHRMRPQLASHPMTVDLPDRLPNVRVDATFLTQTMSNLLENAIRHTPANAPIAVRAAHHGDAVTLVVEDGGPGVTPETMAHLFERFHRGPSDTTRSRRGIGLGLAVVRGLMEAMGGDVAASWSELGGLAVTLTLPAAAGASDATEAIA